MDEYDKIVDWYAANRQSNIGIEEVAKLLESIEPGARVLDLGCGNGRPISQWLIENGFEACGLDSSAKMIDLYRRDFPDAQAECASIEQSNFFSTSFSAVISWGVFFHLPAQIQEMGIRKVAEVLKPGGKFLFTSGKDEGVSQSSMNGVMFTYTSLGSAAYQSMLKTNDLTLIEEYSDAWDNYIYIAQKVLVT